ncbi:hypothetical protein FIBSPDRAFT_1042930 [Athelia psychrophila]|uniref:DUF6533 domain-containing protein n=1 Tax=Athelia psychrophila TaxID=1759441 RepID=A0A166LZQ0_9AGAM|nr:hypothetical protein FIBSPDRAFT_1042930 [Fibularhizoctonia sp. CBS 109695]
MAPMDLQSQLNVSYFTTLIPFVILYYDYSLTFADEVERFWNRNNFTWASTFFFINRYLVLLGNIPVLFAAFWDPSNISHKTMASFDTILLLLSPDAHETYRSILSYHQFLLILSQLVVGIMLVIRVYAMYGRSRWIIVVFAIVVVSAVSIGCWASFSGPRAQMPEATFYYAGCNGSTTQTQGIRLALAWMGQLGFDALVFYLTLYKSFVLRSKSNHLISTLLRDGSLYFAIMTAFNIGNIVTIVTAPPHFKGAATLSTNVISATMMSRLMLNLRDPRMINIYSGRTMERTFESTLPVMTSMFATKDDHRGEDIEMVP